MNGITMCVHPKIIFRCAEIRKLDQLAIESIGIPGVVLMENAGLGVYHFLKQQPISGKVVICCGGGNNGGDGFVLARHLFNQHIDVVVLLSALPKKLSADAKLNFQIAKNCQIPIVQVTENNIQTIKDTYLKQADWIIDALLGTGLKGAVKMPYLQLINDINQSKGKVVSIDIPSGLHTDTGEPLEAAVKANYTLTFMGLKHGFLNPKAHLYLGETHIIDIGIPRVLLESLNGSLVKA